MELFGWALVLPMLGFIYLASTDKLKDKYGQPLPLRSRGAAIGAGFAGLSFLLSIVGAILDRDRAGAINYAILLALLATLVLIVSRGKRKA